MSYQYNDLDQTNHEVRLVEVLPKLLNGIINCRIHHTTLRSHYACLSYTWGSSQKPHEILINGRAFFVGTNLHDFLQIARRSWSGVFIWIDAICINQADPMERNHQVQLMGRIYGGAKQVLVWLGSKIGGCEDLLRLVSRKEGLISECLPSSRARWKINELQSHIDRTEHTFKALNEICCLVYWNRIWTVQEFILAHSIILMYGSAQAEIELFESFLAEWTKLDQQCPPPHMKTIEHFERIKRYCDERSRFRQSRHAHVSLESLLFSFHDSQCTDQEDRIYAMLSLAKRGEDFLIDYREPILQLSFRTLCFCKPKTLQELARLSSLLISILDFNQQEQRIVQDFVIQAQRSATAHMSVIHFPAPALEVQFLGEYEVSQDSDTSTVMLGCPREYDRNSETQHVFDFVMKGTDSSRQSSFCLVLFEWLSMHLELICIPQDSKHEQLLIIGTAIRYPCQLADYVYAVMITDELSKTTIQHQRIDDEYKVPLGYDQLLSLLDYLQFQRDAWNEEHEMDDICFGEIHEISFRPILDDADDDALDSYVEDSESQESTSDVEGGGCS